MVHPQDPPTSPVQPPPLEAPSETEPFKIPVNDQAQDPSTFSQDASPELAIEEPKVATPESVSTSTQTAKREEGVQDDTKPVLTEQTPDWIKRGLVTSDLHTHPVGSSFFPTLEQCREDLDHRLLGEAQSILDQKVLRYVSAQSLSEISNEYVKKNLLTENKEFDNVQERPSGTYHQLWAEINISDSEVKKIRDWERNAVAVERVKGVGIAGAIGVATIGLLSGAIGFLARRDKTKLKPS